MAIGIKCFNMWRIQRQFYTSYDLKNYKRFGFTFMIVAVQQ